MPKTSSRQEMSPQKVIQTLRHFDVAWRTFFPLTFPFFLLFSFYVNVSDLWLDVTYSSGGISPAQVGGGGGGIVKPYTPVKVSN
jgi:hypothetical protein